MRDLLAKGELTGPPLDLMQPFASEMLFDTTSDPHEINNLAESDNPEHQRALVEMRAALETWMAETGDRGEFLEPSEVVTPFIKEMHDWFGTPSWAEAP